MELSLAGLFRHKFPSHEAEYYSAVILPMESFGMIDLPWTAGNFSMSRQINPFYGCPGPAEGLAIFCDPLYILLAKDHRFREAVTDDGFN